MLKQIDKNDDAAVAIYFTVENIINRAVSEDHKRDMKACGHKFLIYLIANGLYNKPASYITENHVQIFLSEFLTEGTSGFYYANQIKRLKIIFTELYNNNVIARNLMNNIKQDTTIPDISKKYYFEEQLLEKIFNYTKEKDFNFYIMTKINYFLLIKYKIIRSLTRKCFDNNFTTLTINLKEGIVRYDIPEQLQNILKKLNIEKLSLEENIFTQSSNPFSQSTFFKNWSKYKAQLVKINVLPHDEYDVESFAHTNIFKIYSERGDVYEIQKLLNFADKYKTKIYLKSIFGDRYNQITKVRTV